MLGDLGADVALVDQPQGLVVQVQVHVALHGQELDGALAVPGRPVVRGEHDVELVAPQVDRLGEVVRPGVRVADHGAADGQDVVQRVGGVLGRAQGAEVGEVEVHLRRRLGARRHLEHDPHAVDRELLAGGGDVDRRGDQRRLTGGGGLPQPGADLSVRPLADRGAVHVAGAAGHRGPGEHVLRDRVLHEALGGDHRHPAGVDVLLADDALHATEVVDVGVRVDHRLDRPVHRGAPVYSANAAAAVSLHDQRVDDDDAGVALDEA